MDSVLRGLPPIPEVELVELLGWGAHAVVVRGRRAERSVAVKIEDHPDDRRFWREASTLARIEHRGMPRLLDAGRVDGRSYLVMELLTGRSLADRIADGPLPPDAAAAVAASLADVLAEVHRHGWVHCDVKPANVLVGPEH